MPNFRRMVRAGALSRPQVADGMSFSDVVDYLFVIRQSLDGVLKRLERPGCVVRRPDTTDRPVKKVVLTPEGRAAWDALQPKIYEFYRQTLEGFRFDDKVSLGHFLRCRGAGSPSGAYRNPAAPRVAQQSDTFRRKSVSTTKAPYAPPLTHRQPDPRTESMCCRTLREARRQRGALSPFRDLRAALRNGDGDSPDGAPRPFIPTRSSPAAWSSRHRSRG